MTPALFFSQRTTVVLLASFCCCLWGSAYPAIKNGYLLFGIETGDVPSKFVFAGYRFLFAGLVLLALAVLNRRPIFNMDSKLFRDISIIGLVQTGLQYTFFYIGLAHTTGVKGSIMNATGTFFSFLLAHFCYGNDRLNTMKLLGCLIGFLGVTVVNFNQSLIDFDFSLLGDGFVIMSAFVLAAASIFGKRVSQRVDTLILTGYQLAIGGLALLAAGYVMGGGLSGFTVKSSLLLVYLILLSSVAFALWTALLKYNRVGLVTVFNFLIPVFGAVLSALFLGESILEWKNLVALGLVSSGIWLVTREARGA